MTTVHIWEKVEIVLEAQGEYANPYTEVEVWVDLAGPGSLRRAYGFWDGGSRFVVRVLATEPGLWSWISGSNQDDAGLNVRSGAFTAEPWTSAELEANPNRRGFLQATAIGHALQYADGTPFFLLGDTWWAVPTWRYPWFDDDAERPIGPEMGFKDMVRFRKAQGYNCIAMIAALPNWDDDGYPARFWIDEERGLGLRHAWPKVGTGSAEDMHNEGGRAFLFPGKVPGYESIFPDMDRINPDYFRYMDRKVDYLGAQGFVPFIEVARRDASTCWKAYYDWPASYARYVQYVFARYQANQAILSPIHFDTGYQSVHPREYSEIANDLVDKGVPAFGTLLSCNATGSSLVNFGNSDEAHWLTLHQIGNRRHHDSHWLLTEIYRESYPPKPALNGEPYYAGWPTGTDPSTPESDMYCRSGMYGSFLSGGLAGHIYGAEGLWDGHIEPEWEDYPMWVGLKFPSGAQMTHLLAFVTSEGRRYQDLVPDANLVSPNSTPETKGNRGWAYAARTPEKDLFLAYFEADCPQSVIRGAVRDADYAASWFDPRTGEWSEIGVLHANMDAAIPLPAFPWEGDWAVKLKLA